MFRKGKVKNGWCDIGLLVKAVELQKKAATCTWPAWVTRTSAQTPLSMARLWN
jgi:hypothetical protein